MGLRPALATVASVLLATLLPATAMAGTGGTFGSPPPTVSGVACVSSCDAVDVAHAGSTIRVSGTNLGTTVAVGFLGAARRGDETTSGPASAGPTAIVVRVPAGTVTGPVLVALADGRLAQSTALLGIATGGVSGKPRAVDAKLASSRVFAASRRGPTLTYVVRGPSAVPVRIDVVRRRDTTVVASWNRAAVVPGVPQTVEWKTTGPQGRYQFRITTGDLAKARSAAGRPPKPGATPVGDFALLGHEFPIRGAHDYGTAVNRFGAPRGGGSRSHRGQDVMADCGTPLVAARGGTVTARGFESLAGNYLVISGGGTDEDYAYMHLRDPALVTVGARVYTGQRIGVVGETGDATACHLHFELWIGPWYDGGEVVDPLPALKAWDRDS